MEPKDVAKSAIKAALILSDILRDLEDREISLTDEENEMCGVAFELIEKAKELTDYK